MTSSYDFAQSPTPVRSFEGVSADENERASKVECLARTASEGSGEAVARSERGARAGLDRDDDGALLLRDDDAAARLTRTRIHTARVALAVVAVVVVVVGVVWELTRVRARAQGWL